MHQTHIDELFKMTSTKIQSLKHPKFPDHTSSSFLNNHSGFFLAELFFGKVLLSMPKYSLLLSSPNLASWQKLVSLANFQLALAFLATLIDRELQMDFIHFFRRSQKIPGSFWLVHRDPFLGRAACHPHAPES